MSASIELNVNGENHSLQIPAETPLLEVLRDDLGLTGSKYGCGEGMCGACTVLIDGKSHRSCITAIGDVAGKSITTIEAIAKGDRLHPLQQAFIDEGAMQCAYCVSGMIMSAHDLLSHNSEPTREQILEHMQGNVCRCGGYPLMLKAIERAAEAMR